MDEADRALMGTDLTPLEESILASQEIIKIRGKVCISIPFSKLGDK